MGAAVGGVLGLALWATGEWASDKLTKEKENTSQAEKSSKDENASQVEDTSQDKNIMSR